ncbi:MAG: thioredoxin family protein [Thiotrichales bacterium]|nr:MAG: thioredoxin family protein [Thiotrichales bacterium]
MALTKSTMLPLGTSAPNFKLLDVASGMYRSLDFFKVKHGVVVVFICNHCPYVKHIKPKLLEISKLYMRKGIDFIAINSNDVDAYPEDSVAEMRKDIERFDYPFAYLFDSTQEVAKAYQAVCTPDFYLFDEDLSCVYRGRFDASTPGSDIPVTGEELTIAMDNLVSGKTISEKQTPSLGCNVKWKQTTKANV